MQIVHDLPKEVLDFFNRIGIVVDEWDESQYYFLPQWFRKDKDGIITEVPFEELPEQVKNVHINYINKQIP